MFSKDSPGAARVRRERERALQEQRARAERDWHERAPQRAQAEAEKAAKEAAAERRRAEIEAERKVLIRKILDAAETKGYAQAELITLTIRWGPFRRQRTYAAWHLGGTQTTRRYAKGPGMRNESGVDYTVIETSEKNIYLLEDGTLYISDGVTNVQDTAMYHDHDSTSSTSIYPRCLENLYQKPEPWRGQNFTYRVSLPHDDITTVLDYLSRFMQGEKL